MRNFKAQIAIAFVCVILGVMISIQLKSVKRNDAVQSKQFQRADELQLELSKEKEKNENLYKQLLQYEKDLNSYEKQFSEKNVIAGALKQRLDQAEILSGLTAVEGKGVVAVLNDSKLKNEGSMAVDENYFVIHDEDILMVLNELADAGAEALSLNDERLIATSEIRCAGATVSVNNNRYSTPFTIKAIGNPDTLEAALNLRGGVVDILKQWGIEVSVKKSNKIFIPRYDGYINFEYAVPVKKGGGDQ
ncbi:MAG: DUF881 domain-containing protein [Firmicutes bacterium]|nr:DUF881 domain-containing protein [Bacillota bacterium]